jgi:hypothetical protein
MSEELKPLYFKKLHKDSQIPIKGSLKSAGYDLFSYENFIKMKIDNNIYTRIKIGNPYQEIIAWLDTEEYSYYLYKDICKLDSYYDETKSKTFCPNNDEQFLFKGYGKTTIINESFTFGQKEIKKFPIIFMQNPKNDKEFNQRYSINDITGKSCVTIGLRFIKNYYETNAKNFISVLNELDIIDDSFKINPKDTDLYSFVRLEDIDYLKDKVNLERIKIINQDGPTEYMKNSINKMDDKTFDLFIKYHLSTCERKELLGSGRHILDILKKTI